MSYRRSRVYSAPVPKMPPGLLELMDGLSKDVLRNNPSNIYEFCADHMETLLQIRDKKPSKNMNLEEKITKAQKIISERANRRHEKYDEMINETKYMQKKIIIIPQNDLSTKQVELLDRSLVLDLKEPSNEIINECNEDEYVRNLLIKNSSINARGADDNSAEEHIIHQNHEPLKHVQVEGNDDKKHSIEVIKDISMHALESKTAYRTLCEMTINNKTIEDVIANPDAGERNEKLIECKSLQLDVNEIEKCTTHDNNQDPTFTRIGDDKHSKVDLKKPDELMPSLEITSDSYVKLMPSDRNVDADTITTVEHEEQECRNGIERGDKNSSDESEMSSERNHDQNDLINDGTNNHTMDLETAAITIQKVFRSFLFKCKTTSIDESTNVDINLFINDKDVKEDIKISNINIHKERRGISRMDTVLQTVNEEKSLSLSTDDSSTLSSAATVIQAHIRGFLVRNKLHNNKTLSTSLLDSDAVSGTSLETDSDQQTGKTILNIHIVPERGHFVSRDESLLTSMDLSMDGCPRSLTNLHPHSYDINERRKQLKREDAVQSVSPPSNSSSKLSEDIDSVRECLVTEISSDVTKTMNNGRVIETENSNYMVGSEIKTAVENEVCETSPHRSIEKLNINSDEMDVVTPDHARNLSIESENKQLMHSSEFHEVVLPTQVSRTDTSVVREFHNVLAYFLLWN